MFASAHTHFSRRGLAMATIFAATFALMMQTEAAHAAVLLIG